LSRQGLPYLLAELPLAAGGGGSVCGSNDVLVPSTDGQYTSILGPDDPGYKWDQTAPPAPFIASISAGSTYYLQVTAVDQLDNTSNGCSLKADCADYVPTPLADETPPSGVVVTRRVLQVYDVNNRPIDIDYEDPAGACVITWEWTVSTDPTIDGYETSGLHHYVPILLGVVSDTVNCATPQHIIDDRSTKTPSRRTYTAIVPVGRFALKVLSVDGDNNYNSNLSCSAVVDCVSAPTQEDPPPVNLPPPIDLGGGVSWGVSN